MNFFKSCSDQQHGTFERTREGEQPPRELVQQRSSVAVGEHEALVEATRERHAAKLPQRATGE